MKVSCVISLTKAQEVQGGRLAARLSLPYVDGTALEGLKARDVERFVRSELPEVLNDPHYVFLLAAAGLSLAEVSDNNFLTIQADFHGPTVDYRRKKGGGKGQMIAKAVGMSSGEAPTVLDVTAGLGSDAFVLASLGCSLTLVERVPEVRALLEDGLRAAREWGQAKDATLVGILDRMRLVNSEAVAYLQALAEKDRPDVVYLDPMFPVRTKSALVKKEMRVFHQLVGVDPDADALLGPALASARKRVVVKRPRLASALAGSKPSFALDGKRNRFDIYIKS